MDIYLLRRKEVHSSRISVLSHLAGLKFVPNFGIKWQLDTIKSIGMIAADGIRFCIYKGNIIGPNEAIA